MAKKGKTKNKKVPFKKKALTKKSTAILSQKIIDKEEGGLELDPRRQQFAAFYNDPLSTTFSNAYRSGIRAGFTPQYSESILSQRPKWLSGILGKSKLLEDMEKHLEYHVNLNPVVQAMGAFGPLYEGKGKDKKPIMVESSARLKLRQEILMFGLEKLHPDFKKREKFDKPMGSVEIKQIIIIAPNGDSIPYNKTNAETISSISEIA